MAINIKPKKKNEASFRFYHSDALSILRTLEDNSIDSICSDPPYGLGQAPDAVAMLKGWLSPMARYTPEASGGFCGASWDNFVPQPNLWKEVLRVLKPGGYIACFAGTRTVDLMGLSLRIAGFEPVDLISWHYGQGFPKSMSISKAFDKDLGLEREVVGVKPGHEEFVGRTTTGHLEFKDATEGFDRPWMHDEEKREAYHMETAPASKEAKKWEGYGTQIKPATEPILIMRKPLEGTYVQNIRKWGVGALNIDTSRVPLASAGEDPRLGGKGDWGTEGMAKTCYGEFAGTRNSSSTLGRYPSNVLVSHTEECVQAGTYKVKVAGGGYSERTELGVEEYWGEGGGGFKLGRSTVSYGDAEGNETVALWNCHPECPTLQFPEAKGQQGSVKGTEPSGKTGNCYGAFEGRTPFEKRDENSVTAARFFYQPKASKTDRNRYCSELTNNHTTVKPIALMEYLVALITPEGGTTLDPFTGSGTTGLAALLKGFNFIGTERDANYYTLSKERLTNCKASLKDNDEN